MHFHLSRAVPRHHGSLLGLFLIAGVVPFVSAAEPSAGSGDLQAAQIPAQLAAPRHATLLTQLVAEALQDNPEIQAARKEWEAASQRVAPATRRSPKSFQSLNRTGWCSGRGRRAKPSRRRPRFASSMSSCARSINGPRSMPRPSCQAAAT